MRRRSTAARGTYNPIILISKGTSAGQGAQFSSSLGVLRPMPSSLFTVPREPIPMTSWLFLGIALRESGPVVFFHSTKVSSWQSVPDSQPGNYSEHTPPYPNPSLSSFRLTALFCVDAVAAQNSHHDPSEMRPECALSGAHSGNTHSVAQAQSRLASEMEENEIFSRAAEPHPSTFFPGTANLPPTSVWKPGQK